MVAVTEASRNAASAFKLIEWLASPEVSTQLTRDGGRLAPVRRSLASSPDWYEPGTTSGERGDLAKHLEATLSRQEFLFVPRIPGVDKYISALDVAVGYSVAGKYAPRDALLWASGKWESITNSYGRQAQRSAYLKHLGISEN
jgi:ABC-type glycerol-3-phosphate transport system substrate-binding protein